MAKKIEKGKNNSIGDVNDKRIIRTKKYLRNALFKLLKEKDVSQITVTELCNEANINRSTFYTYYDDIEDMLKKLEAEFIEIFTRDVILTNKKFDHIDDYVAYVKVYLEYCKNNSEICQFIITRKFVSNKKSSVIDNFSEILKDEIKKVIPNSAKIYDLSDPRHYLSVYAISGILNAILQWMEDGMVTDTDKMAYFLAKTYVMGANTIKTINIKIDK